MLSLPTKNQRREVNQLAELVPSFICIECYSHQGTRSTGSEGLCQDAGSNPGSGKRLYFSMTRFVHDNVPLSPFRDIEIITKSPLSQWRSHLFLSITLLVTLVNAYESLINNNYKTSTLSYHHLSPRIKPETEATS